jgi:hypothetical protein
MQHKIANAVNSLCEVLYSHATRHRFRLELYGVARCGCLSKLTGTELPQRTPMPLSEGSNPKS